jgi:hypothetical protein
MKLSAVIIILLSGAFHSLAQKILNVNAVQENKTMIVFPATPTLLPYYFLSVEFLPLGL